MKSPSPNGSFGSGDFQIDDGLMSRTPSRRMVWVGKMPLPLRRSHVGCDLLKHFAVLMTLLTIALIAYLVHFKNGFTRIMNDPFDSMFYLNVNRNSPVIWQSNHQSFLRNAFPVPVHSHNDYTRRIPLYEALGSGCISVEADVHLHKSELYVGHTSYHKNADSTLRAMYLEPLQRMLDAQNENSTGDSWTGLYNQQPQQTLVLLIDHKTSGPVTTAELYKQLQPLRDRNYLTFWNGTDRVMRAITVVATGNAQLQSILSLNATHRDIFLDAPLENLHTRNDTFKTSPPIYTYNISNSYFASTKFSKARPYGWWGEESTQQNGTTYEISAAAKDQLAGQLQQAKDRGLLTRYWGTPSQPPNLREVVWRVLIQQWETDIMNMDDMGTVRDRAHAWGKLKK